MQKISTFNSVEYKSLLSEALFNGPAPYRADAITSALLGVVAKAEQDGVFTEELGEYLVQRVAMETGIIEKLAEVVETAALNGKDNANNALDTIVAAGIERINSLNNGTIDRKIMQPLSQPEPDFMVYKLGGPDGLTPTQLNNVIADAVGEPEAKIEE